MHLRHILVVRLKMIPDLINTFVNVFRALFNLKSLKTIDNGSQIGIESGWRDYDDMLFVHRVVYQVASIDLHRSDFVNKQVIINALGGNEHECKG